MNFWAKYFSYLKIGDGNIVLYTGYFLFLAKKHKTSKGFLSPNPVNYKPDDISVFFKQ